MLLALCLNFMRKKNIYERIENGNHHVLFAAVPLILFFCLYYVTRFGIGITPDSTFYISAARSIAQTGEIRSIWAGTKMEYLTHYPPCYPIVIFLFNLIVENSYEAVRVLNNNQYAYYLNASIALAYPMKSGKTVWIEPTYRYSLSQSLDANSYMQIRPSNIGLNVRVNFM